MSELGIDTSESVVFVGNIVVGNIVVVIVGVVCCPFVVICLLIFVCSRESQFLKASKRESFSTDNISMPTQF